MPDPIVVVGASLAATRFVRFARRAGHDGPVVVVGDEPHAPYDRPPLSKQYLAGGMSEDEVSFRHREDDATTWRLGVRAERLDRSARRVCLDDGSEVVADHVVVATGATPRPLPGTDGLAGVHVLRTLDDARRLRDALDDADEVAVVGAGFIGCEVAATARALGRRVTVVDPLPAPVVRGLGARIGGAVEALHRRNGVAMRLGVGVAEVEIVAGRAAGLRLDDDTVIAADAVVVGIGARPATDWLAGSGLELDDGVVCDAHLAARGGGGHVWAIGDVCRWTDPDSGTTRRAEHWTNAQDHGRALADNLLGTRRAAPFRSVPYVWSDQHGVKIQVVGTPTAGNELVDLAGDVHQGRGVVAALRRGVLVGAVGFDEARLTMSLQALVRDGATRPDLEAHVAGSSS